MPEISLDVRRSKAKRNNSCQTGHYPKPINESVYMIKSGHVFLWRHFCYPKHKRTKVLFVKMVLPFKSHKLVGQPLLYAISIFTSLGVFLVSLDRRSISVLPRTSVDIESVGYRAD
jgi:hypothetical protein